MELMSLTELQNEARLMSLPLFMSFVGIIVLLSDLIFNRADERRWPAYLTIAGLIGSLFLWIQSWLLYHSPRSPDGSTTEGPIWAQLRSLLGVQTLTNLDEIQQNGLFNGMFDPIGYSDLTLLISLIVIIVALVTTLISPNHLEKRNLLRGEFYALMIFASVGLIVMAGSRNLIMLFLGLELLSIPLYILSGFARPLLASQESAIKYFLLGAFSSAFLLYGIALTYGATGTMDMPALTALLGQDFQSISAGAAGTVIGVGPQGAQTPNLMLFAGLTFLLVGIGFKISLVPFHQWTPDVYEGAPTPVTAFMVAGTKVGGFAMLINVLVAFIGVAEWWAPMLSIVALLTMIVGNVGALRQTNIKRMLAYSSIAHAGYMLVGAAGIAEAGLLALSTIILYLAVYALMNLGTFAVLMAMEEVTGKERLTVTDFRGLWRENTFLCILLAFFLLSLAGFPPTAGFFSKFFLFSSAIVGNNWWLVLSAVVLSVISVVYYARFIVAMFMQAPVVATNTEEEVQTQGEIAVTDGDADVVATAPQRAPMWMLTTAVVVTTVVVLFISLFPTPALSLF